MGNLANSEDPDEMQHNAVIYQGMQCLLRSKQSSGTEIAVPYLLYQFIWENLTEYQGLIHVVLISG